MGQVSPLLPLVWANLKQLPRVIIRKGKLPAGINPPQLSPRPVTIPPLCGCGHMAQGIFSCLCQFFTGWWHNSQGKTSLIQIAICPCLMSLQNQETQESKAESSCSWLGQLYTELKGSKCSLLHLLGKIHSALHPRLLLAPGEATDP